MKRSNTTRRALRILAAATGLLCVAAAADVDGDLSARSTDGDTIDMRFAAGTLLGMTVAWAAEGPCGSAQNIDLALCPNCPDAEFVQGDRLAAQGDVQGGGTYSMTATFQSDGATGTLSVAGVAGCPADHTITWASRTLLGVGSAEPTAITSVGWAALKASATAR